MDRWGGGVGGWIGEVEEWEDGWEWAWERRWEPGKEEGKGKYTLAGGTEAWTCLFPRRLIIHARTINMQIYRFNFIGFVSIFSLCRRDWWKRFTDILVTWRRITTVLHSSCSQVVWQHVAMETTVSLYCLFACLFYTQSLHISILLGFCQGENYKNVST